MSRTYRVMVSVALVLALLPALAGCRANRTTAGAGPLVVYTYSSFGQDLVDLLQGDFAGRIGRPVEVRTFSDSGPLFNQLVQEKDAPKADAVIGLDSFDLPKAVRYDLLLPYRAGNLKHVDRRFVFDRRYRLLPFDYGYVLFNYDSGRLTETPRSYLDLTLPKYKGQIVIENPRTSSPGRIFLLATIALYGEKGYLDYWRKLKPNLLTITPGWDEAYGMYTNGEVPIVLSYGTSPVYHLENEHTERYKALVLDGAAYAQIEGVGIVKGTGKPAAAKALVEYVLDLDFQNLICSSQYMYPVNTQATQPDSFRVAAQVDKLLHLDETRVASMLDRWLDDWEKVMTQ